jgi:HD-like signal output (HDOD) protein
MQIVEDAAPASPPKRASSQDAFEFVKSLASELSSGKIELPSFPDIAMRVQRVLTDERATPERIVRVVSSEPTLAARVMSTANSAALNPTGRHINDLKTAITRLGFDMLRSAAMSFSMAQLRRADQFKGIEKQLNQLWQRSVQVATLAYVIAKRYAKLPPDTALLAGLLHNVGRLYILTRASQQSSLFADVATYNEIVRDWHSNIAKALLENWDLSNELIEAIHSFEDLAGETTNPVSLIDVLAAAALFATFKDEPELLASKLHEIHASTRLGLVPEELHKVLSESAAEIAALREALGN